MTAPSDPDATPEPRDEEQDLILRLGDILPRVPAHLLKPGPHDAMLPVRFSVEELAEGIARGRVSVPLERLSSIYPQIFRDTSASRGEQEIPLPLQKLLEQVGLMARKPPASNGMPPEQLAQARGEAGRIIKANAGTPVPTFVTPPSVHSVRIAKAISTARQIFGLFGRAGDKSPQAADSKNVTNVNPKESEKQSSPQTPKTPPVVQLSPPSLSPPEPAVEAVPSGFISLRLLSIYRLMPVAVLRSGTLPDEGVRVALPLSVIDPQLEDGHVEIPLEDFVKALPDDLRQEVNMVPETRVWIPLDEIFQNLPPDHIFYMPPLDPLSEAAVAPEMDAPAGGAVPDGGSQSGEWPSQGTQQAAPREGVAEQKDSPAPEPIVEPAVAPVQEAGPVEGIPEQRDQPAPAPVAEPAAAPVQETTPAEAIPEQRPSDAPEPAAPTDGSAPAEPVQVAAEKSASEAASVEPPSPETPQNQEASPVEEPSPQPTPVAQESTPEPAEPPSPAETASAPPAPESASPAEDATLETAPPPVPPTVSEPGPAAAAAILAEPPAAPEPPPSRAPWMRGFQIPAPRLFVGNDTADEAASESEPAAPVESPPAPAPTPEAKQTADFLASQPGIFAAAAFVEGAVFASADFPRKPDLDALREFMGAFIEGARESGRRLGWNRVLAIPCEQFHLTAVVRDNHFIVALHQDRVLPSHTHDALILAADELSKAGG